MDAPRPTNDKCTQPVSYAINSRGAQISWLAGLTAFCVLLGCAGVSLAPRHIPGWALWPPTGLGLGLVIFLGGRALPAVWIGSLATGLTSLWAQSHQRPFSVVVAALGIATGATAQIWIGAWLTRRYANGAEALRKPQSVLWFVALAAILGTTLNATSGTVACALTGVRGWSGGGSAWLRWWLADVFSTIVLAPVILAWSGQGLPVLRRSKLWEAIALVLLLLLLSFLAFGAFLSAKTPGAPLAFFVIPGMLWAALRFGARGTAAASLLVGCIAVVETLRSHGPFASFAHPASLLLLQTFLVVVSAMSLVLAADVAERRLIAVGLRSSEQRYRDLFEEVQRLNRELETRLEESQRMLAERNRVETALRESDRRLHLALAAGKMGTWTLDLSNGERMRFSPELESILGLKPGEFDGSMRAVLELVAPEDRDAVRQSVSATQKDAGEHELEFRFLPRGRKPGWLLARGQIETEAGKAVRLAGVGIEITAQKEAEQEVLRLNRELERRVSERTAQLEAINKELEAFSYSVSHDLRAPLRSIRGFSEVLLERYADKLDARGREFLHRVGESSQHMDRLIEDLLKLSRVGRSELQLQDVNLSALAEGVVLELRHGDPKRPVAVNIQPGLRVRGDERLLRIVMENLLRNAWKFTSKEPAARIEFGQEPGSPPAFFVRDNGAGFDMAYAQRLFGVFQRLHSSTEFPGIGVGLATVRRIITRHDGRVWAEGAPNQGAVFHFTVPAQI